MPAACCAAYRRHRPTPHAFRPRECSVRRVSYRPGVTTSSSPVCPSLSGTASEGSNECLPCLHDAQCPLKRCEKLIRLLARQAIARRRVVVDKHDERLTQGLGRSLFWIVLYAKASHIRASWSFPVSPQASPQSPRPRSA